MSVSTWPELRLRCCHLWPLPSCFFVMTKRWKAPVAATLVFLAALFNVDADEHPTTGQTTLGTTTLGGHSISTITSGAHRTRSGITGQVFDILSTQDPNGGMFYSIEPVPVTLWIYDKIKVIDTAQDGTFFVDVPPGDYFLETDPASGYLFGGVIGLYADTLHITVHPWEITYDEIYVVSDSGSPFPG